MTEDDEMASYFNFKEKKKTEDLFNSSLPMEKGENRVAEDDKMTSNFDLQEKAAD